MIARAVPRLPSGIRATVGSRTLTGSATPLALIERLDLGELATGAASVELAVEPVVHQQRGTMGMPRAGGASVIRAQVTGAMDFQSERSSPGSSSLSRATSVA